MTDETVLKSPFPRHASGPLLKGTRLMARFPNTAAPSLRHPVLKVLNSGL